MALVVVAAVVVVIVVVVVVVIVIIAIRVVVAVVVAVTAQATLLPSCALGRSPVARPTGYGPRRYVAPCFTRGAAHCAFLTAARPADNADQVARAAWGSGSGWGS